MNFRVLRKVNPGVCGNILRSVCLVNAFRKWVTEFWNALSQRGRAFRADHRLSCYCSPRGALASQPGNLSGIHGDAGSAKALTVCVRIPQTTRTRSTMRLRSNSATAPRTVNIILPVGVVVPNSMACRRIGFTRIAVRAEIRALSKFYKATMWRRSWDISPFDSST